MPISEESALPEVGEATGSIRLHVDGDWTVADLERLLTAAKQMYNVALVAYLARSKEAEAIQNQPEESEQAEVRVQFEPIRFGEPGRFTLKGSRYAVTEAVSAAMQGVASPSIYSEPITRGASAAEADTFRLRLLQEDPLLVAPEAQLTIQSISMASPGWLELKGLGEPIKQVGKLIERLVRLPGKVIGDKIDRDGKRQANKTRATIDEIEIVHTRMAVIEDYFRLQWGPDFRSVPGVAEQIPELLSGVRSISDLARSGHLLLPPANS